MKTLTVLQADITTLATDAIVNAANARLLGGGGVDGAIHQAAGPGLYQECLGLGGCEPGQAKITGAHALKARHIIHTVGPVWAGGLQGEPALLASCYRESLRLAAEAGCRSIAFPAISTGVYGYPLDRAARIAATICREWLQQHEVPDTITLVAYDSAALRVLQLALEEAQP